MRIGVDLGGTKIEGIALANEGQIVARQRVATPADDHEAIVQSVAALVRSIEAEAGCRGAPVGIGTPGALSPTTGLLRNSNTLCLNGHPLDREIARALGRPVRLANDANCFALSEASDGAAAGAAVVFGVILGTGTGAGVVVQGQGLVGRHGIAGEWGHMPLPWPTGDERPGPPCYCGRTGCLETFLSGPGLARDHERTSGASCSPEAIVAGAAAGDPACERSLQRYVDRLARGLAVIIDVLDPDAVVLGGGLSNVERWYARVPEQLSRWVFSDVVTTPILRPRHGDSSGVRGAAWLWPQVTAEAGSRRARE